jgi:ribosomal protein S18 acetylase RimI-like enzyme
MGSRRRASPDPAESPITVRFADARDVPALVALNRVVQALHAEAEPSFFRPVDDLPGIEGFHLKALGGEGRYTLVAELEDEVVGYASVELQRRGAHTFAWAHSRLHVHQVSVDPRCRRRGVGRALMAGVDALAAELSTTQVALDSWTFNTGARRFFEALGYSVYNLRFRKDVDGSAG